MTRGPVQGVAVLAALAALVLGAANLWLGELNQDEGWYLYAARMVSEGWGPYRDFAFTQAPVLPFVYALFQPVMEHAGVAGGRAVSLLFGLLAAAGAAGLAARVTHEPAQRPAAAVLAFALTAVNVYQSYFTTVVKTYALCACFLIFALLLAVSAARRNGPVLGLAAGLLAMLAAGTRISAGAAVPLVALWMWIQPQGRSRRAALGFALGATLAFVAIFVRWWLAAPDGFRFGVFDYHAARQAGSLTSTLVFKAGFVSRVIQAYTVAGVLALALVALRRLAPAGNPGAERTGPRLLLWAVAAGISLVHFSAPVPYDDYQALVYPVFCAALAGAWLDYLGATGRPDLRPRLVTALLVVGFLASAAAAASSPVNQSWMVKGRDRIWWRLKEKPDLAKLREAAAWVRANSTPRDMLLTQDLYLAVEAHRRVPHGLEMGPFSYYPGFERGRAYKLNVLDRAQLTTMIHRRRAPLAALSGYAFAIDSPAVQEVPEAEQRALLRIFEQYYEPAGELSDFGQGQTTLRFYRRRAEIAQP